MGLNTFRASGNGNRRWFMMDKLHVRAINFAKVSFVNMNPLPNSTMESVDVLDSAIYPYASGKWSGELLTSLDWKRLVEIARAMSSSAGFELSSTRVKPDGLTEFEIFQGAGIKANRAVVRLVRWNQWMATAECVTEFADDLREACRSRGILIAPGGFTKSAMHTAIQCGVEAVDANILAERLNALPAEHSDYFFDIGTAGDASTPSCPVCLHRMESQYETTTLSRDFSKLPDLSYRTNDIIAESVTARMIEIHRSCEVHFLHEVRAQDIIIHGVAVGDFVCDGTLLLNPGAALHGSVAARSVLVRPGATLHGLTRIIQGAQESHISEMLTAVWRCPNPKGKATCKDVTFVPHA
jgi:hypothetical protein